VSWARLGWAGLSWCPEGEAVGLLRSFALLFCEFLFFTFAGLLMSVSYVCLLCQCTGDIGLVLPVFSYRNITGSGVFSSTFKASKAEKRGGA